MKPIHSVITILPRARHSGTGMQGGGHGLETPENFKIAKWLVGHIPGEVDKALVSRASSHGAGLTVRFEGRYPVGADGERLPSYQVAVGCDCHGKATARATALEDARKFMIPAPARVIEEWLAELSVIVARRRDDEIGDTLRLAAYSSRLVAYPADVVRHALLRHTWQFWPTWAELESVCEDVVSPRNAMVAALARPELSPKPERRPPTVEERSRIAALIAEMFPAVSKVMRDEATNIALEGNCMKDAEEGPKKAGGIR